MDENWRLRAKCRGQDPGPWELDSYGSVRSERLQRRAIELCSGCPVTLECALAARQHSDTDVIRSGVPMIYNKGGAATKTSRAKLDAVIASGGDLSVIGTVKPVSRPALTDEQKLTRARRRYADRRCSACGAGLRPDGSDPESWPGREEIRPGLRGAYFCKSCYELERL
ncbi:WhiB family transcriptional regulator [Rhodococcus sp. 11-3]|uniref:WhiB family transcriptional regulator n=1 Tax=Rhodococcus sp. 11-3 TaxID=2854796 RepID=UPI002041A48D|nr:WhiB family transcriptional regulator [Rhodococcus sp. 11-3]USC16977.1 WhiB family transcriptional regulator [Rhodococcus sp. 11-3]